MSRPWPTAIDRLIDGAEAREVAVGRWSAGPLTVTHLDGRTGLATPEAQVRLLEALAGCAPFAVPRVVGHDDHWLVAEPPVGLAADRPDLHPEPAVLATTLGRGLAALHALAPAEVVGPTGGDGLDRDSERDSRRESGGEAAGWAPIVDRCRRRIEDGLVDATRLPPPYDRYGPERLLELLAETTAESAAGAGADDPVLCHGSAYPGRFVVDGDRFVGLDGFESALVADRHLDLATAHLWVADLLGSEAVFALYDGYGIDPRLGLLDRAVLAVRLLGTGPGPGVGAGRT